MPKVLNYAELVQESAEELLQEEKAQNKAYLRDRVRFLRFLQTGIIKSQSQAGKLIGLQPGQSTAGRTRTFENYISKRDWLVFYPKPGNHWGKLSSNEISQLLERMDQDDIKTQKEIQTYLQVEMGQDYSQPGIHYLCKRLKVKLKTARPSNIGKDETGAEVFKKTLPS